MSNGCSGKVRHKSKEFACIVAKKLKKVTINVYRCKTCNGWHLGNTNNDFRWQQHFDKILSKAKT